MNTDLVLTLRHAAQGVSLGADGMGWSPDPAVMGNAADEIERLRARLDDALFVLVMVDKNNRIDAGEKGKAWNGRFVVDEVRRVLDEAARAAGPNAGIQARP